MDETDTRDEFDIETISSESVKAFRQYQGIEVSNCFNFQRLLNLPIC
jgi:hypothetical protein